MQFANEIDEDYRAVRLTADILRNAAELTQSHPLKAYDAIQLSAALAFEKSLRDIDLSVIFVSGDEKLVQAARVQGLAVENPFDHADLD